MMRQMRGPLFLVASVVVHGGLGVSGAWLAHRVPTDVVVTPKPTFVGETFDIAHVEESPPEVTPTVEQVIEQPGVAEAARARPRPLIHGTNQGPQAEAPLTYGALGDRSASSVIVAVSRGFPQAASSDPVWVAAPFGDAGEATLEIELAEDGTLTRWSLGPGATPALRTAMVQTMALIGSRTFIAHGAVTKIHVAARVTEDAVRDGTDAVYAIHSEHEGDTASAYFSLSSGRRIELVMRGL